MSSVDVSTPADDNVGLMESVGEEGDKEQAGRERERASVCLMCSLDQLRSHVPELLHPPLPPSLLD